MTDTHPYPADDMATFDDRWTVRYIHMLKAPVPRVWEAVTSSDQLNIWFIPISRVEAKLGGSCLFSWGKPEAEGERWTVTRFEPKKIFQITRDGDQNQYLRFELEAVDANTRFTFINGFSHDVSPEEAAFDPENKLLALSAGPDTPIRAGILEGYHYMADEFGEFLAQGWSAERMRAASEGMISIANTRGPAGFGDDPHGEPSRLAEIYYEYIRDNCPPTP